MISKLREKPQILKNYVDMNMLNSPIKILSCQIRFESQGGANFASTHTGEIKCGVGHLYPENPFHRQKDKPWHFQEGRAPGICFTK